jgi:hypothetical protein
MKKFFAGFGFGLGIQLIFSLGVYGLISYYSPTYVNSPVFITVYPSIICLLISAYIFLAKKSYKFLVGMFVGLFIAIVAWIILLAGV